jgi:GNAT superfamily N-acetyltransferase
LAWRSLKAADLSEVKKLSDQIHKSFPEGIEIFEERLRLYPDGCLVCEQEHRLVGYAITHPWMRHRVPPLNTLLGALPTTCRIYHFHDVALLASVRGQGLGASVVERLRAHASNAGFPAISLVAVSGSAGFYSARAFAERNCRASIGIFAATELTPPIWCGSGPGDRARRPAPWSSALAPRQRAQRRVSCAPRADLFLGDLLSPGAAGLLLIAS